MRFQRRLEWPPPMPIRPDDAQERRRFADALELARSGRELPAQWLERTRMVGQSPNRTFVAMLGTALLQKATGRHVRTQATCCPDRSRQHVVSASLLPAVFPDHCLDLLLHRQG
jgi:hypothetical protein